jgi:hypothetical protein
MIMRETTSSQVTYRHCFTVFNSFVELGPWLTVLDKGSQRSRSLPGFCVTVAIRDLEIRIVGIEQRNDLTLQYGRILQTFVT